MLSDTAAAAPHPGSTLPISVIIVTRDEADQIGACLASVKRIASEIIVLDSGSTDKTCLIASEQGAQVHQTADWPGFGAQKNRALALATQPLVLSLDADERLTPALEQEIRTKLTDGNGHTTCLVDSCVAYAFPRLSQFCGEWVYHSGWHPDYVVRLFRRDKGRFKDRLVHECVLINGKADRLRHPLLHYSYRSHEQVKQKIHRYADAGAQSLYNAGVHCSACAPFLHAAWSWLRTFIFRAGFLDGKTGWAIAFMNARTSWHKYRKLRHLIAQHAQKTASGSR